MMHQQNLRLSHCSFLTLRLFETYEVELQTVHSAVKPEPDIFQPAADSTVSNTPWVIHPILSLGPDDAEL